MHIKKLEISGFKSFVDKTIVHFDHDVIGIVGPNGCGKSNIVDAIRWCMGEQSAKHLRGRSMEDIIFNGSETRPQLGMAEVTLTFDNAESSGDVPELYRDYPEIAVTRRLFRDGTSEYLLNKTPVRLRDVTDLFLGTGVGTKAYSIVEQGRIGQIVSSRPQDRRMYIEEAAGITKYRLRRKQAERKMDQTRQNLLRVSDIVAEIDRTRSSLKRQAAKAERYLRYREDLEDLFLHDAAHRMLGMLVTSKLHHGEALTLRDGISKAGAELKAREGGLSGAREGSLKAEREYDQASGEAQRTAQRVAELRSTFERTHDRMVHLEERLSLLSLEHDEITSRRDVLQGERKHLDAEVARLAAEQEAPALAESGADEKLRGLQEQAKAAHDTLQGLKDRMNRLEAEKQTLTARHEALSSRERDLRGTHGRLSQEQQTTEQAISSLEAEVLELEARVADRTSAQESARAAHQDCTEQLEAVQTEAVATEAARAALAQELGHKRARLTVLEDHHRRLEGVGAGTRALLTGADPAVVGLLADRLSVPERFTQALAGLLGETLQCVIVDDAGRGIELLGELSAQQAGRATIAPRLAKALPNEPRVPLEDGIVARLIDELGFAPEDEVLVRALVGETVVVATAGEAYRLNQAHPNSTVVALDGTVVRGAGLVSGGSGDSRAANMVEQKREIAELRRLLEEREPELAVLVSKQDSLNAQVRDLRQEVTRLAQVAHQLDLERLTVDKDLGRASGSLAERRKRLGALETQIEELAAGLLACAAEQAELESKRTAGRDEYEALLAGLEEASVCASEAGALVEAEAERVMEQKLRLAQIREQLEAQRRAAERAAAAVEEAGQRLSKVDAERDESAASLGEACAHLMLTREAQDNAERLALASRRRQEEVRAALDGIRQELGDHESELQKLREEQGRLDEQLRERELVLQKIELEREHLVANVADRFRGLDLKMVVGDYHMRPPPDSEHRRRIDELTKLLDRMGPVNLDAKTEYEEAESRFVELSAQKTDIEESLAELESAIRHMDRESKRRFRESYDAINTLFKQTFTRLFKGGRGELKLTDPDNILETGVDIIAQPPGKKLGNIELMSGGEKALTATALIFAIFQHRPSPFCILDEVDAPLDEANVGRYNDAIRAMTSQSQFIIITHIKKTMQAVDVLYGVTMGEPGVSRLVSVKVNDQATSRSARTPGAATEQVDEQIQGVA